MTRQIPCDTVFGGEVFVPPRLATLRDMGQS